VCVVLLKTPDPNEPRECASQLVSMQNTEVCELYRQLLIRSDRIRIYQAVPWTVHWLQSVADPVMTLCGNQEQIFLVVFIMTRNFPQVDVEDVGCDYLLETAFDVLIPHKVDQFVVNFGSVWQKECATRGVLCVPEEQLLRLADHSMITLGCLFTLKQKVLHLLLLGK
jgi:hypothetical protein